MQLTTHKVIDMNKEQAIKEVMELVLKVAIKGIEYGATTEDSYKAICDLHNAEDAVEAKLRELINESHQAGHEAGSFEADEAASWNRIL